MTGCGRVTVLGLSLLGCSGLAAAAADGPRSETLQVESFGGVRLTGDLRLPAGEGPFPVVVLTHGSEPGRRSHRGYRRWAEAFRDRGIGALVFDKRGVGSSSGTYVEAPDLDVPAADVNAWVDLLKRRPDVRSDAIGVLGWSQGGWVGPLAASKNDSIAFVVSISGPGVSPLEQNIYDKTNQFLASGAPQEQVDQFSSVIRRVWTYLVTGEGRGETQAAWDAVAEKGWFVDAYHGPPMMDRELVLGDPRMTQYVAHSSYEPAPVLESLRIPMLALFGSADTIVPVERSIAEMRDAFSRGSNDSLTIHIVRGGDHGLRTIGPDGARQLAPDVLGIVGDWILTSTQPFAIPP